MRVIVGDLWDRGNLKVIPVNLSVNRKGEAIMGKGIASQARDKFPNLASLYGTHLMQIPNKDVSSACLYQNMTLIMLPVKMAPSDKADIQMIRAGLEAVKRFHPFTYIDLPLLGCGFGELEPLPVITMMASILTSDNFTLVLKDETVVSKYESSFRPGSRTDRTV